MLYWKLLDIKATQHMGPTVLLFESLFIWEEFLGCRPIRTVYEQINMTKRSYQFTAYEDSIFHCRHYGQGSVGIDVISSYP